ncbi:trimethylamine N-oxide reductase system protein TorE [Vibrio gallicus]|uniref:trimethylamine N-oxide reductase system protein TorE n=1 Tax=Vibrio gallicus TaxID=190897 RepID=UPI0021C2A273|nr:trimethylamine N-oxide reductase system protein TorE [Vibrio gallicus]
MSDSKSIPDQEQRSLEWKSFFFIAVVLFPILSVIFVGGYGFSVWMLQMFVWGPPGVHG